MLDDSYSTDDQEDRVEEFKKPSFDPLEFFNLNNLTEEEEEQIKNKPTVKLSLYDIQPKLKSEFDEEEKNSGN